MKNTNTKNTDPGWYKKVHGWLRYYHGPADHCDFCNKLDKRYDWALIKGCQYDLKKDNFMQLCKSCHMRYDENLKGILKTEEHKRRISNTLKGSIIPDEVKQKISNTLKGREFTDEHKKKIGDAQRGDKNKYYGDGTKNPMYGRKHSDETKRKISESQILRCAKKKL